MIFMLKDMGIIEMIKKPLSIDSIEDARQLVEGWLYTAINCLKHNKTSLCEQQLQLAKDKINSLIKGIKDD